MVDILSSTYNIQVGLTLSTYNIRFGSVFGYLIMNFQNTMNSKKQRKSQYENQFLSKN